MYNHKLFNGDMESFIEVPCDGGGGGGGGAVLGQSTPCGAGERGI